MEDLSFGCGSEINATGYHIVFLFSHFLLSNLKSTDLLDKNIEERFKVFLKKSCLTPRVEASQLEYEITYKQQTHAVGKYKIKIFGKENCKNETFDFKTLGPDLVI